MCSSDEFGNIRIHAANGPGAGASEAYVVKTLLSETVAAFLSCGDSINKFRTKKISRRLATACVRDEVRGGVLAMRRRRM
jgi:hypothetical protein